MFRLNVMEFLNFMSYLKDKEYFEKHKTLEDGTDGQTEEQNS